MSLAHVVDNQYAGLRVFLLPGTYPTGADISLSADNIHLTATSYTNRPIVKSVTINSNSCVIDGLEFTSGNLSRETAEAGDHPSDIDGLWATAGVTFIGSSNTVQNCIIHDCREGINSFGAPSNTVKFCLIYNNGWWQYAGAGAPRGNGHGFYSHNHNGGTITIEGCIMLSQFNANLRLFSGGVNNVRDYTVTACAFWDDGNVAFTTFGTLVENLTFTNNSYLDATQELGRTGAPTFRNLTFTGNWLGSETQTPVAQAREWKLRFPDANMTLTGNKVHRMHVVWTTVEAGSGVTWNNNEYYLPWFYVNGAPTINDPPNAFTDWKTATGYDSASTYTGAEPAAEWVRIYEWTTRANVATLCVWNWNQAGALNVDLSGTGLATGDYKVINAHNLAESVTRTYSGGTISVPFTGWTQQAPIGTWVNWTDGTLHTDPWPLMGVFILEPV